MDYIYGQFQNQIEKVEYNGLNTNTAITTINNNENTIKVDVINLPNTLNIGIDRLYPKPTKTPSTNQFIVATINQNQNVSFSWKNENEVFSTLNESINSLNNGQLEINGKINNLNIDLNKLESNLNQEIITRRTLLNEEINDRQNADNELALEINNIKQDIIGIAYINKNNNFSMAQTFNADITINGNITQNGEQYITHAEQVKTRNDKITLREGATGGLTQDETTGIVAEKYDGTNNGLLVFDATGTARVGDEGDTQPLATRSESNQLEDGQVMVWDATNNKIVGSNDFAKKDMFVVLTQEEYDAIETKDNNIFYFIKEETV